jgi:pimeloyl-ACP methyl ester carboxylesterase
MVQRKAWKRTRRIAVGLTILLLAAAAAGFAWRTHRLREIARAVETPYGINDAEFIKVGGIDQWITIRGQNRDNPVLLLLHGGPGNAFQSITRRAYLRWEKQFTIVQWDQRGAGKTYGRSGPVGTDVTVHRMVLDGAEVAEYVRAKLHKRKIILIGHSWGSILGIHLAMERPDLFSAYVGTGQVVNHAKGKVIAWEQLKAEARERGDRQALQELNAIGPPPYASNSKSLVHTKWANRFEPGTPSNWTILSAVLLDSPATIGDFRDLIRGIRTSEDHFRGMEEQFDLTRLGTDFAIPVFVFQGAVDNVTPVPPLIPYMESIRAPQKELILIPNAGHNALITRSNEFLALLTAKVRPLGVQSEQKPLGTLAYRTSPASAVRKLRSSFFANHRLARQKPTNR